MNTFSRAVTSLEEAREKLGEKPAVRYHFGMAHYRSGKPDAAAAANGVTRAASELDDSRLRTLL